MDIFTQYVGCVNRCYIGGLSHDSISRTQDSFSFGFCLRGMVVSLQDTKIIFTKSFAIGNTGFKAFQMHLLIAFLVVNKNNYCCLPMCRFHYRLTMWILNLKPTRVPFSSGKYNCSYRHLSRWCSTQLQTQPRPSPSQNSGLQFCLQQRFSNQWQGDCFLQRCLGIGRA